MPEPTGAPTYVVAICDGSGCRELLAMGDARDRRHAVRRLVLMAAAMRGRDVVEVLKLTEAATMPPASPPYGAAGAPASGKTTWKVVPCPGSLSAQMRPPCNATISRAIGRPRPVPGMAVPAPDSTRA